MSVSYASLPYTDASSPRRFRRMLLWLLIIGIASLFALSLSFSNKLSTSLKTIAHYQSGAAVPFSWGRDSYVFPSATIVVAEQSYRAEQNRLVLAIAAEGENYTPKLFEKVRHAIGATTQLVSIEVHRMPEGEAVEKYYEHYLKDVDRDNALPAPDGMKRFPSKQDSAAVYLLARDDSNKPVLLQCRKNRCTGMLSYNELLVHYRFPAAYSAQWKDLHHRVKTVLSAASAVTSS